MWCAIVQVVAVVEMVVVVVKKFESKGNKDEWSGDVRVRANDSCVRECRGGGYIAQVSVVAKKRLESRGNKNKRNGVEDEAGCSGGSGWRGGCSGSDGSGRAVLQVGLIRGVIAPSVAG